MSLILPALMLSGCTDAAPDTAVIGEPSDTDTSSSDTADTTPDTTPDSWALLVINEFMASNQTVLTDETGAYGDWIELYNPTDEVVELAGWSISDDLEEPDAWMLDDFLSIEAGGHLLLWADGDPEEGPNHLGFNLSRKGGQIGLYAPGEFAIDLLKYAEQASDLSAARTPDGSTTWEITDAPTPGESNTP